MARYNLKLISLFNIEFCLVIFNLRFHSSSFLNYKTRFAIENKFNEEQISAFLSIIRKTHEKSIGTH